MDVSGLRFVRHDGNLFGATEEMFTNWQACRLFREFGGKVHGTIWPEHKPWDGQEKFTSFYPLALSDLDTEETSLVVEWALS